MRIAEIAYPLPLHRTFDYEVPESLSRGLVPGMRVRAPFGPRASMSGVVMSVREGEPSRKLKAVAALLDPRPLFNEEMLDLARWLSRRYCAPIGECLKSMLPSNLRNARREIATVDSASLTTPSDFVLERDPTAGRASSFELTAGQAEAVARLGTKLRERKFSATLLFGVPASGKTEVYIRLIREAVSQGGQAMFLLPEISLTKPFFEEFSASVGLEVALWHSQLGARHRRAVWLGLRDGSTRVVVGARSASLLPFKDLRLAIMDEEQDESYKQDGQAPFYHARDVVLERARRAGATVVLGSATPSIEAFAQAERGELELARMDERVSKTSGAPAVRILERGPGCIAPELLSAVKERLARREQVILLVNRRGYSNFILCRRCGWVARCPACAVAFIHHENADGGFLLRCHHCGRSGQVPPACGQCRMGPLTFAGVGTQKVVSELRHLLPGVRVLRMDRDTVSKEKAEDAGIYERFKAGGADVLVGTKLVAKGFHFPDVTLVGVVDADTMLHMPDFRSAERTVQLLVQAAGRAGRAEKPGEVLLQTAQPTHYAIQAVARGDYALFARQELAFRKELDYPPSSTLVRLLFLGKPEEAARDAAQEAAQKLREELGERASVLGPAPGVHARLQGRFRYHLLLKVKDKSQVQPALESVLRLQPPSTVKIKVNVDPYDFF